MEKRFLYSLVLGVMLLGSRESIDLLRADEQSTSPVSEASSREIPQVERGLSGTFRFQYAGGNLKPKAQREVDPRLIVRLRKTAPNPNEYEAKFIGSVAGEYDLRDFIEREDGKPLADLYPLKVNIESKLPVDRSSDLFSGSDFKADFRGGYQFIVGIGVFCWVAIPAVVLMRRYMNRKPQAVAVVESPPPTFAEQIRPLLEAAASGAITVPEQARLELLVYHYWKKRIASANADLVEVMPAIRVHAVAGPLVSAIERWLHDPKSALSDGKLDGQARAELIVELLRPYANELAVNEVEIASGNVASNRDASLREGAVS